MSGRPPRRRRVRSVVNGMLERRYRLPGMGLTRDQVRAASVRGDLEALRRLRAERGPLEGEQGVRFGLELPGPGLAGEIAATLRADGYTVEVQRGEHATLLVAETRMELDEDALRARGERFCALADGYAGRYRGWALLV